jgi:hypothetical protein
MKIFVSWSGKHSLGVATALKEWLPIIFNDVELFVSSEDIRKGKRWRQEISKHLETCNFGIACLTPENTKAEWILFESGALSKHVQDSSLWTLLLGGLRFADIDGPLSDFQHTAFEKDDFYKLLKAINDAHTQGKHDEGNLKKIFEKFWDELESNVAKALKSETKPEKKKSTDEILNQVLEIVSQIARNTPARDDDPLDLMLRPTPKTQDELWNRILEEVGKESPFTKSYLLEAEGKLVNGMLTIHFNPEFDEHVNLVDNERNRLLLEKVLAKLGYTQCGIRFTSGVPNPNPLPQRGFPPVPARKPKPS